MNRTKIHEPWAKPWTINQGLTLSTTRSSLVLNSPILGHEHWVISCAKSLSNATDDSASDEKSQVWRHCHQDPSCSSHKTGDGDCQLGSTLSSKIASKDSSHKSTTFRKTCYREKHFKWFFSCFSLLPNQVRSLLDATIDGIKYVPLLVSISFLMSGIATAENPWAHPSIRVVR